MLEQSWLEYIHKWTDVVDVYFGMDSRHPVLLGDYLLSSSKAFVSVLNEWDYE